MVCSTNVSSSSNTQYSKKYIDELLPTVKIVPAAIQLEIHPQLPQSDITEHAKEKGIHVIAYSPLGSTGSPVATIEPVVKLAEKKGATPVSILLSHHGEFLPPIMFPYLVCVPSPSDDHLLNLTTTVARGNTVLAKSVNADRIKANKELVALDADDLKALDEYSDDIVAKKEWKRFVYPPFGIDFGFPDKS